MSDLIKRNKILLAIIVIATILRIWRIDQVPVSLFGDELDVGYHAYSILKTGKDYMGNSWPLHFHSLAEWRTPLYLYSAVPTVALFGISPLGVRLPAAIFGIANIWLLYLLVRELTKNQRVACLSAFVLAVSPWHIQYSRAGFEVTQLLFFLLFGLLFFFKEIRRSSSSHGRWLWVASASFAFMPWVYSSAKLFVPILLLVLFLLWYKPLLKFKRQNLIKALVALVVVGGPIAYSILFGGGAARFSYVGIFTDPTLEQEVGYARSQEAIARGELGDGLVPTLKDRIYHNKFTFWRGTIAKNYLTSLSSSFLFSDGDPNPRHSITGMGMFYKVEFFALIAGVTLFFTSKYNWRYKVFMAFWILGGVLPSALTRDGGNHATRLILILPPLVVCIAYGISTFIDKLPKQIAIWSLVLYGSFWVVLFLGYQDFYWVHNPRDSERWWHAGWQQAIQAVKQHESEYDIVIVSTKGEPPWTFFAAWYAYPPEKWQKMNMPNTTKFLEGYGEISYIDKFYFGSPQNVVNIYDYGKVMKSGQLYLASADEVNVNLIREPDRTPGDLQLIESIAYPSGEPAFYLFAKSE